MNPILLALSIGWPEIVMLILIGTPIVFYIWTLLHCIKNPNLEGSSRALWILIILFFPLLGSLIYLLGGKKGAN